MHRHVQSFGTIRTLIPWEREIQIVTSVVDPNVIHRVWMFIVCREEVIKTQRAEDRGLPTAARPSEHEIGSCLNFRQAEDSIGVQALEQQMGLAHLLTVGVIERGDELRDSARLCRCSIRIVQRVELAQKLTRIAGEWIGNRIGFNQMAFQEIVTEALADVPIPSLRIAILYTLKQLSECVRCIEIITCMGCVPGQFPHAEVCDAEGCSVINIKVGLRHEYIPRMQIAMLFSSLLQLIQELKHGPQKALNER